DRVITASMALPCRSLQGARPETGEVGPDAQGCTSSSSTQDARVHHSCAHCVSTLVSVWESRGLCGRAGFTQRCAVIVQDGRYPSGLGVPGSQPGRPQGDTKVL